MLPIDAAIQKEEFHAVGGINDEDVGSGYSPRCSITPDRTPRVNAMPRASLAIVVFFRMSALPA